MPTTDPRSYRISQAILARIRTIVTAGGFVSNVGANVLEGRESIDTQSDNLPLTSFLEGEGKIVDRTGNRYRMEREVYVDAYAEVPEDSTVLKHGHLIRADILRALMPWDSLLNGNDVLAMQQQGQRPQPRLEAGLVEAFTYEGDAILAFEGDNCVNTVVAFKVLWTEDVSNPTA